MTALPTITGRLVRDCEDVSQPSDYQFLTQDSSPTRIISNVARMEIACPQCGQAHELAPVVRHVTDFDAYRWDGSLHWPTLFRQIELMPHGSCPGWKGYLEGGQFRPAGTERR